MKYRTVVMYVELGCFVCCLSGWVLVCSTLPIEYWTWSEVGTLVLTTGNYYMNLWKDCVSDTTGVSDCKEYPSMLALSVFLHVCRALAVCAVITGFFGGVLTLIGMKCTKIGGSEVINARVTFAGGLTYLTSGFCGLITYSWWGNKVISEFVDPNFRSQKFELGAALFIGWGGAILLIVASSVMTYFSGKEGLRSTGQKRPSRAHTYATARTPRTYMQPPTTSRVSLGPPTTSRVSLGPPTTSRGTLGPPTTSRVSLGPPLFYEGRKSRGTTATRTPGTPRTSGTPRTYSRDDFV